MTESASGSKFVHLHTHSQYSLLQGAIQVEDLVKQAAAFGQTAIALTERDGVTWQDD